MRLVIPKDISQDTQTSAGDGAEPVEHTEVSELITQVIKKPFYRIATLQERVAAFLVDMLINAYLFLVITIALQYFMKGDISNPFQFKGNGWFIFATTLLATHFLYFFFFEGIITATPGKIFTGLSIQRKDSQTPSLFAILIRNVLRLVDYPLFFITGLGMVESSNRRQRLGDWLAGTIVACLPPDDSRRVHPSSIKLSGAIRRGWAFIFDALLVIATAYGILLMIPTNKKLPSLILLNSLPVFLILYLTFAETLFQTTFGKAIFGMKIVREDGRAARFGTVFIRNIFKLFDINPLNYLAMTISSYKQKLGDSVAGTVVVNDRKGFWGWLSVPYMLSIPTALIFVGLLNGNNFWKTESVVSAGFGRYKVILDPIPQFIKAQFFSPVSLQNINLSPADDIQKATDTFSPGDTIFVLAEYVSKTPSKLLSPVITPTIQSLEVIDPNGVSILKLENVEMKPLRFLLHPQAIPGDYILKMTVQDHTGATSSQEKKFSVNPTGLSSM